MPRAVEEWIGKTDDTPAPPRVKPRRASPKYKRRNVEMTMSYLEENAIPEPNSGCLIWMRAVSSGGYGRIGFQGKLWQAHRLAIHLSCDTPIRDDLDVCHKCDVRLCINPKHLFVGTRSENMADCAAKGRAKMPNTVGENNPNSSLTTADIIAIRADRRKRAAIALAYGVSGNTIYRIRKKKTWGHI